MRESMMRKVKNAGIVDMSSALSLTRLHSTPLGRLSVDAPSASLAELHLGELSSALARASQTHGAVWPSVSHSLNSHKVGK